MLSFWARSCQIGAFFWAVQFILIAYSERVLSSSDGAPVSSPSGKHHLDNLTSSCEKLKSSVPTALSGQSKLDVYVSEIHEAGSFSTPMASVRYNAVVPNLPEFCRFGAFFNTSSQSRVQFEVWLPIDGWSGRMAFVGNGGDAGGVNYPDMGIPLAKYKFAVVSTDTGHNGTDSDGTFVINNPETQYDFGYRAVHLSTMFSKVVVQNFYGEAAKKSYWIGCSSGGRQGLKEAEAFPEDFDGILAGAAAQWWTHLCGWAIQVNLRNLPTLDGHLRPSDWKLILNYTIQACDALDGVKDGVITDPSICNPNLESLLCTQDQLRHINQNETMSICLTEQRISVAKSIYEDWVDENGNLMFPSVFHGSEDFGDYLMTGVPFGPGPDYLKYQVLNFTEVDTDYEFTPQEVARLVKIADSTDPGQYNVNGDISPYIKRGGKLMTYVGMSDPIIPSRASIMFHDRVKNNLGIDPRDSYRLFAVPGMGHCGGGTGASNMGAASQRDTESSDNLQSASFDAKHDMILALIEWTETGTPPEEIITTKYVNGLSKNGVKFQRKLCPWPLMGKYVSGDPNLHESYTCQSSQQ